MLFRSQCAEGHTGTLCASCIKGYSMLARRCEKCAGDGSAVYITFIVINVIACVALVFYFLKAAKAAEDSKNSDDHDITKDAAMSRAADSAYMSAVIGMQQADSSSGPKDAPPSIAEQQQQVGGTLKIIVGYLQIFTSFKVTLGVKWPRNFLSMINFFQFINVDFMGVFSNDLSICSFALSFWENFLVYVSILPVFIFVLWVATGIAFFLIEKAWRPTENAA